LLLFHGAFAKEFEHALGFVGHAGVLKLPNYLIADPGCRAPVRLSNGGFESLAEMLFHSLDHVVGYRPIARTSHPVSGYNATGSASC